MEIWRRVQHEEEQIDKWRREFEATYENPIRLRDLRENILRASQRVVGYHLEAELETARAAAETAEQRAGPSRHGRREAQRPQREAATRRSREREIQAAIGRLQPDAPYQKPFLWPVAFLEVFQHGGFDVVLANPPYVRQEKLASEDQQIYKEAFGDVFSGTADLLVFFYARALQILRDGGWLAFITSNKFTRSDYGRGLRTLLQSRFVLEHVIDFGHIPVFDADVYPIAITGTKRIPEEASYFKYTRLREPIRDAIVQRRSRVNAESVREELEQLGPALEANGHLVLQADLEVGHWSFPNRAAAELLRVLDRCPMRMSDVLGEHTYWGIKTAFNDAYILSEAEHDKLLQQEETAAALVTPWLRGQDIRRWSPAPPRNYLLLLRDSADSDSGRIQAWSQAHSSSEAEAIFRRTQPNAYRHVRGFEAELKKRLDHGRYWWELRPCTYYWAFDRPKLVWRDISYLPQFAWDESHSVVANAAFISASAPRWLVAYANSTLFAWIASHRLMEGKDAYFRWLPSDIGRLPVPAFDENARQRLDDLVVSAMAAEDDQMIQRIQAQVDTLVFVAGGLTAEQRQIVQDWFVERMRTETLGSMTAEADDA